MRAFEHESDPYQEERFMDESRVTRALLIFLFDRVCDHDEFFDIDGYEHVVGTTIIDSDTAGTVELDGRIFDVVITAREV
jgi:hypothetical protein